MASGAFSSTQHPESRSAASREFATLVLAARERLAIGAVAQDLPSSVTSTDDPALYEWLALASHRLPLRLREFLLRFRLDERAGVALIRGLPLDSDSVGPTPSLWREEGATRRTLEYEVVLLLCGSLIGDPFAWATQQGGALVNDVIPVKGHEYGQVGASSLGLLKWHTEDAFHPFRADWLALACVRNPHGVGTTVAHVDDALALVREPEALFRQCVFIRPDEAQTAGFARPVEPAVDVEAVAGLDALDRDRGGATSVLSGSLDAPELCIDPAYMEVLEPGSPAAHAVDDLCAALDRVQLPVVLEPGEAVFIDNRRVVHGRGPFQAHYDGSDRWLKRINVMRDIRRAREAQVVPVPPVII